MLVGRTAGCPHPFWYGPWRNARQAPHSADSLFSNHEIAFCPPEATDPPMRPRQQGDEGMTPFPLGIQTPPLRTPRRSPPSRRLRLGRSVPGGLPGQQSGSAQRWPTPLGLSFARRSQVLDHHRSRSQLDLHPPTGGILGSRPDPLLGPTLRGPRPASRFDEILIQGSRRGGASGPFSLLRQTRLAQESTVAAKLWTCSPPDSSYN